MRLLTVVAAIAAALAGGCRFPADTDGTLDRVAGGTLRVGVVHSPPFVVLSGDGEPAGVEPGLVRRFAAHLDAEVKWIPGGETELMQALHGRQLDIVIAGLTRRSLWSREVTLTRPYINTKTVIAAPDAQTAEALSADLEGHEVAVEAHTATAAKLAEDTDATVKPVESLEGVRGPAAVDDFLLDDLGLIATDAELDEHEHAMAVSMGENAFLVELERYLLDSEREAEQLLAREGKP